MIEYERVLVLKEDDDDDGEYDDSVVVLTFIMCEGSEQSR